MLALPPPALSRPDFRPCAALLLGLGLPFLLMLCPRPARAQYGAVAGYTGGTATSGTTTRPYTYDYPGGIYVYGGGLSASAGSGDTASCTGGITATFTWVSSTLPPPSSVIIEQSAEAWARGSTVNDVYTPPASCSVNNPYSSPGSSSSPGTLVGTQYSAKSNPGTSFSVTCSGLSSSATPQASSDGSFVFASVSYSAAAFPITISLPGTTRDSDGNDNILIGQFCTALLAGIPSSCTVSGYQWSVGGTTFQSWSPNAPNTFNSGPSQYIDGPGPLTYPTASWYWNDSQMTLETVSCTATVTPPAGEGSPFTVTAQKQVKVYIPIVYAYGVGGTMQVNASSGGDQSIELYAGPIPGSGELGGMNWHAKLSSPVPALFATGTLGIAQVISPYARFTTSNQPQTPQTSPDLAETNTQMAYIQAVNPALSRPNTKTYYGSQNGQTGLDGGFPYPWVTVSFSDGDKVGFLGGDEPGFPLDNSYLSAELDDNFVDYLMYKAPGSSQWVPVSAFHWVANGNVTLPSTGRWSDFTGSAGSVTSSGSQTQFVPANSFPSWTQTLGPGFFQ